MDVLGVSLFLVAAGTWVGTIIFHSAIVAPTVFTSFAESDARLFLRKLFPRFFKLGLLCGVLMLVGLTLVGLDSTSVQLVAALTTAMLVLEASSLAMVPGINAARDAGPSGEARFRRLHRINVLLTVVVLLLGIGVLVATAFARPFA